MTNEEQPIQESIDMPDESLMQLYRMLRNGLNDMIEGNRLTEADVPDDFEWLVTRLNQIARKEEEQTPTEQEGNTSSSIDTDDLDLVFSDEDGSHVHWSVLELLDAGVPIDDNGDDMEFVGAFVEPA